MLVVQNRGTATGLTLKATTPAILPVSLSDVKDYLKVNNTTDDSVIKLLHESAVDRVERYIGRKLITQTITAEWMTYEKYMWLPYAPVQSVTSVTRSIQNTDTTLTLNTDYYTQGQDDVRIEMAAVLNNYRLKVVYVAGYGDSSEDVPAEIREAILYTISWNYENREGASLPAAAQVLLDNYKIYR